MSRGQAKAYIVSEPRKLVKNLNQELLGFSRFGVFWAGDCSRRMGEFYQGRVYGNDQKILAELIGDKVFAVDGSFLGSIEFDGHCQYTLCKNGVAVGYCTGQESLAAAAGLVLFYHCLQS